MKRKVRLPTFGMKTRIAVLGVICCAAGGGIFLSIANAATLDMNIQSVATGYTEPVDIANTDVPGDDRLFVVERSGIIRIMHTNGTKNSTPFLDIHARVTSNDSDGEEGLLGIVFNPSYASNKYFYVTYVTSDQSLNISRFTRDASNPDIGDPTSEVVLLNIPHPTYTNHNGGDMHFGPDGYLYVTTGDGGSGGNPTNTAQNKNSYSGKLLRLDVNGGSPYAIPSGNPYAGATAGLDELWSIGLRNPWRFSFDRTTGDLWIGDVGQNVREEVDFQAAGASGGQNYGWRCYEGNASYDTSGCGAQSSYVSPIGEYDHSNNRCAITGGYVYRGTAYPAMAGRYFFADYCSGQLYSLASNGSGGWDQELLGDLGINPSAFGEDVNGEIYVAGHTDGTIYHLETTTVPSDALNPTTAITSPSPSATVSNATTITATATDNIGVARVDFLVDGAVKGSLTASPYTYSWDTRTAINGTHALTTKAYDAAGNVGTSSTVTVTASNASPVPLPSPWLDGDVGAVGAWGSASSASGTFTLKGAGADIGGTGDGFHFAYQPLNGDGQITARVASMQNTNVGAKAGVMIRDNLSGNAMQFSLTATPTSGGGLVFTTRSSNGATATTTTAETGITAPYWVRLQRQGSSIVAYWSSDGTDWEHVSTTTLSLSVNSYIGLAVSSHDVATLNTTTFDNVALVEGGNSPPLNDITYPGHSGIYGGTFDVTTNTSDSDGIDRVEFSIDGTLMGTDSSAPYTYTWNTTTYSNGDHILAAKAYDTLGNSSIHTHIVNIQNAAPGSIILGAQTLGGQIDAILAGQIEAWPFTATGSGNAGTVSLYLAGSPSPSTAQGVLVGLYSDATNKPDTLLATGTITSPAAGNWNTVAFASHPAITNGTPYWIGVLGTGTGQVRVLDTASGSCNPKVNSGSNNLTSLPSSFGTPSAQSLSDCPLSAYVTVQASGVTGDLDDNQDVDADDLTLLLNDYAHITSSATTPGADLNSDTKINVLDLSILLRHFGE